MLAVSLGGVKCAITAGNGLKCWGTNVYGSVGDGTTTERSVPTDVNGLSNGVVFISVGAAGAVCAVINSGAVKCWERNVYGAVDDGSTNNALAPVSVVGLDSGVTKLASGNWFHCALTLGGAVRCWGNNRFG